MENLKDKLAKLYEERDRNDKYNIDDWTLTREIKELRQLIAKEESGR